LSVQQWSIEEFANKEEAVLMQSLELQDAADRNYSESVYRGAASFPALNRSWWIRIQPPSGQILHLRPLSAPLNNEVSNIRINEPNKYYYTSLFTTNTDGNEQR